MQSNPYPDVSPNTPLRWDARMVSDSGRAESAAIRNYLEQSLVREVLAIARTQRPATVALDVGAGFGRLSCVLAEFAPRVVAVERDPRLLAIGQALNPAVEFISVASLERLPLPDGSANLVLTFTVLQHLPNDECRRVLAEIQRVCPAGHILLVEETDEAFGETQFRSETGAHLGRSVSRYCAWMPDWELVRTWPRRIEPTYPRSDVGTAMLFTRSAAAKPVQSPAPDVLANASLSAPVRIAREECGPEVRGPGRLELGCGTSPTAGYIHHDRVKHSTHVDVAHDLNSLPWPWRDDAMEEVLALDVFEHLHLMPEAWLHECHRILAPGRLLRLRVPIFGSPWHVIDPTHVRGFHPLNFDYFIQGRELWHKYGHYYFDFNFQAGTVQIEGHNILATLQK